jgi:hypothetical protein
MSAGHEWLRGFHLRQIGVCKKHDRRALWDWTTRVFLTALRRVFVDYLFLFSRSSLLSGLSLVLFLFNCLRLTMNAGHDRLRGLHLRQIGVFNGATPSASPSESSAPGAQLACRRDERCALLWLCLRVPFGPRRWRGETNERRRPCRFASRPRAHQPTVLTGAILAETLPGD